MDHKVVSSRIIQSQKRLESVFLEIMSVRGVDH